MLDAISDGIIIVDGDHRLLFLNLAMARTFGDRVGDVCYTAFAARQKPCDQCSVSSLLSSGASHAHHRGQDKNGRWYDIRAVPIEWADGRTVALEVARDITALVQAQEQSLKRSRQLSALVEASRAVTSTLEPGQVLSQVVSQAVRVIEGARSGSLLLQDEASNLLMICATAGISIESLADVALNVGEGVAGRSFERQQGLLCNSLEEMSAYFESVGQARLLKFIEATRPVGALQAIMAAPLMLKGKAIGCLALHGYSGSPPFQASDLELLQAFANQAAVAIETAQAMAKMERLATTDDLTSLYNRHHFDLRLAEEVGRARRYNESFSLIITDIDNLKLLNDTQGHVFGDQALRQAALAARSAVRESDVAFRYGGDEFVFMLPKTSALVAEHVAQRIQEKVRHAHQGAMLTLSIGIASFPEDAAQPEDLVRAADAALYLAKRQGGDRICLFDRMAH